MTSSMLSREAIHDLPLHSRCPICQGPLPRGALYCSRLCQIRASLQQKYEGVLRAATRAEGSHRHHLQAYAEGLCQALEALSEAPAVGNPTQILGTEPGDVLFSRPAQIQEYLIVRQGSPARMAAVGSGKLSWVRLDPDLEVQRWVQLGHFDEDRHFQPVRCGHA